MMNSRRKTIQEIITGKADLGDVCIAGWVQTSRKKRTFSFIEINDGSTCSSIQAILDNSVPNYEDIVKNATTGASVFCSGTLVKSPGLEQEYEIQIQTLEVMGVANPEEYPLQKKVMSYEYLRENANFRSRTSTFASIFRIRSHVAHLVHDFFTQNNFFYVQPPVISVAECEEGVVPFQVTTLPLDNIPLKPDGSVDYRQDFFGHKALLSGSGQLQGELLALSLGKIYTFAPTFRAENSNTTRHLAEFWQIEPEMAFFDLEDTIALAQSMIKYVIQNYLIDCKDDLQNVMKHTGNDPRKNLEKVLDTTFNTISYTEAIEILGKSKRTFSFPVAWGSDLQTEHERYLCEEYFNGPLVVYDYPADLKSFYMYLNDDGKTVAGADILVPGIGEIIGSSQREHRLDVLTNRMKQKGMNIENYAWYLDTRRFGSVPHSGFGLGFERLLTYLIGMENIRDVIPFPRSVNNCLY